MDARRKSSSKLKVKYGFQCMGIKCVGTIYWFSKQSVRDSTLKKHKSDIDHKDTYKCMSEDYWETS